MDLSKVSKDASGIFPLFDLFARVEMETESSISLAVGRFTNRPSHFPPDSEWFFESCGPASFFQEFGWIDLHYPCKGHRKVLIRMSLPIEYHEPDRLDTLTKALFVALSIPLDALYVAYYFTAEKPHCTVPKDEFGQGQGTLEG